MTITFAEFEDAWQLPTMSKIPAIKALRRLTRLSLKESKEFCDKHRPHEPAKKVWLQFGGDSIELPHQEEAPQRIPGKDPWPDDFVVKEDDPDNKVRWQELAKIKIENGKIFGVAKYLPIPMG